MNRMVNMIVRIVVLQLVTRGVAYAFDYMSNRNRGRERDVQQGRLTQNDGEDFFDDIPNESRKKRDLHRKSRVIRRG